MKKVTNIGTTLQVLYDKGGKRVSLNKGESALMEHPPLDSYQFKVENHTEEQEKPEKNKKVTREVK